MVERETRTGGHAAARAVGDRCRGKMCVNVLCRELVA
jgi:hypothetical protein